jgi:hypothetical protein
MALSEPPSLLQTAFSEITVDTTTNSTSYIDLLTITITTSGGSTAVLYFTASFNNNTSLTTLTQSFQFLVDGVAATSDTFLSFARPRDTSVGMVHETAVLSAASHTFKVQWKVSTLTGQIRPVTTIQNHASFLVKEMTV